MDKLGNFKKLLKIRATDNFLSQEIEKSLLNLLHKNKNLIEF